MSAHIEQAEAMPAGVDDLKLLLVSIMGTRLGIDAEQVNKITEPGDGEVAPEDVINLHEAIAFSTGKVKYVQPKVITTKDKIGKVSYMIDQLQEIITVGLEDIQPLPPLVEASKLSTVVWGATLVNGEIIILLDLEKLKDQIKQA